MACCTWPPVLSWGVHVGRDTWCIALALAVLGSGAHGVYGVLTAQDESRSVLGERCAVQFRLADRGWPRCSCCSCSSVYRLLPSSVNRRRAVSLGTALVGCLLLYGFQITAEAAINTRHAYPQQGTYIYDLAQMSNAEGKVLLPQDVLVPGLNTMAELHRVVQTGTFDPIVFGKGAFVDHLLDSAQEASLQHAWISAVARDPRRI